MVKYIITGQKGKKKLRDISPNKDKAQTGAALLRRFGYKNVRIRKVQRRRRR